MPRPPRSADWAALGLRPGASRDDVQAAYRRLALHLHPDRNPDDPRAAARFRQLTDSYAAISARFVAAPPAHTPRAAPPPTGSVAIADMEPGTRAWASAAALRLARDRSVLLDPAALAVNRPTPEFDIRVDRRSDGFHVFVPPQPAARWRAGDEATSGPPVVALWVGDRQHDREGLPHLPDRLVDSTDG
ncbi:MAG: J domain-containing protein [Candidatus Dormibacteria bacterium]